MIKTIFPSRKKGSNTYAAIDLGSNSFHMIVVQIQEQDIHVIDRLRVMVRLSAGLDESKRLNDRSQAIALDCLQQFSERLLEIPKGNIRAVGTNTLRTAINSVQFLQKAEKCLGHCIEIISGMEEARLIYLGVSYNLPVAKEHRLVIDIGGGSTEVIIGEGVEPMCMESLYMGCVSSTNKYFSNGNITNKAMEKAEIAARVELEPIERVFRNVGWSQVLGASGTIKAVSQVISQAGWCDHGISYNALKKLIKHLIEVKHVDNIKLKGLSADRTPVFVGGVAILWGIFKAFNIDHLDISEGAVREGVIHDLLGRIQREDVRHQSVKSLAQRFHVAEEHTLRVMKTAHYCLEQLSDTWNLDFDVASEWLEWAARLHEIGLSIAHAHYHKHGAYIVSNADLPGFSQQNHALLAALVQSHRGKFPKTLIKQLPQKWVYMAQQLAIILRLSVLLNRSRSAEALPTFSLTVTEGGLAIQFPPGWLHKKALTAADLEQEVLYLVNAGVALEFS
ncbi:MAG: Ppx/GppA family phosphatase [Gammaproteobacteria bacterium]|nr:Ppx/GppA family phosphatase [Gammaproteobacteria bacterium]